MCNNRSGKTSIQRVVFEGMMAKDTLYLENNIRSVIHNIEYACSFYKST